MVLSPPIADDPGALTPRSPAKSLRVIPVAAPPADQRVRRDARFAAEGERRNRYHLPAALESASPVGYRRRLPLSVAEAEAAMPLLALDRPTGFGPPVPVTEEELFEEASLGVLSSRQSTNYRGHREVLLGPRDSAVAADLTRRLAHRNAKVLDGASYTHVVLSRPYRTPFTALLTVVGHLPGLSLLTVPARAIRKKLTHRDDIPTIGFLQHLHLGVLADAMERATVLASIGERRAQLHVAPFAGRNAEANRSVIAQLERLIGLTPQERRQGWRIRIVAQVGQALPDERVAIEPGLCRKLGANLLAFRSERIQPGVNNADNAPEAYRERQDMVVPEDLREMAGRAAYNAFGHWTHVDRERAKELLLLDRVDVLTDGGKERLREIRDELGAITDRVARNIPWWCDLPTGRALSRATRRGRKAFALAGQRIYICGLSAKEIAAAGIDWEVGVQAAGAAAARSAAYVELMGCVELPEDCDLLAGICLMAGPVNQNDVGKMHFGYDDLLSRRYGDRDPTSLLVWTLKAKTVADPIGNEEQLLNAARKGALVDLRPGPHEVIALRRDGKLEPMRRRMGRVNNERAFADADNFVADPQGIEIAGNRGTPWPAVWRREVVWPSS